MPLTRRRFGLSLIVGLGGWAGWRAANLAGSSAATSHNMPGPMPEPAVVVRTARALGSEVSLTAFHPTAAGARAAVDAAFSELDRLEDVLSLYRPHSQLSRLNRDGLLRDPHPFLVEVLTTARLLSARSQGRFDVTIQPLWKLHEVCGHQHRCPTDSELAAAQQLVDWRRLEVSHALIRLTQPGMQVALNGIAQGFAADQVVATLRQHGVQHALINTGELATLGRKPSGEAWSVGIQHPRERDAFLALTDLDGRCLATSGDYSSTFDGDPARHHLLDPATGSSASEFRSVSILAPTGLLADGLSTAVFVLGRTAGLELVRTTPGVDALCVTQSGDLLRTPGFPGSSNVEVSA